MSFQKTYSERAGNYSNPTAKALLLLMDQKQTNLCVSVDVSSKQAFLEIVEAVGPHVCLIKTHIDIIDDFDWDLIEQLQRLSQKHNFYIFEDRKFADIGSTVLNQYSRGLYKISSWSHLTNAHTVPGPGIIHGLSSVGLPLGRGLLLLAEMSSAGTLARGTYTTDTIELARKNREFVVGFIAMQRGALTADDEFLILTPGVALEAKGDGLGQQYRTPRQVIAESKCDVIIVGRAIYGNNDLRQIQQQAARYREEGWKSYLERLGNL